MKENLGIVAALILLAGFLLPSIYAWYIDRENLKEEKKHPIFKE